MDDFEEAFKIAAFNKLKRVNHLINEITIGPNSEVYSKLPSSSKTIKQPKEVKKQTTPSPETENGIPTRQILQLLDLERQGKAQSALNERISRFEQFSRSQEEQGKQSWLRTQQAFIEDMEKQEMNIIQANRQYDLKQSGQHAKLAQLTQNAVQRMKQRQEILQEKERQRKVLAENVNKIKTNQQKFSLEYQQILGILKSCTDNDALKNSGGIDFSLLKTLPAEIERVVEKCKGESISDISVQDGQKSEEIVTRLVDFKMKFKTIVDIINARKLEAEKAQQESQVQQQTQNQVAQPLIENTAGIYNSAPVTDNSKTTEINKSPDVSANLNKITKYVSINDLQTYTELMDFLQKYRQSFKELEDDNSLKVFKFDCKKAINIPVNALSGVNSEHILDKYRKLNRLLAGQSVVINDKEVNASKHPQGIAFCTDLLAKKFVLQGDLMVSSNPESAFCYASVILSLWNDFPDFGKLLLAYFYKMCPYLVPYYIPRQVGDSDEEFYIKQGYLYKDGEVEKQDKFLKRMTGILRLYFAILISKPKKGQITSPHNLKHGWKWLVSFLRLEPQLDITATALHVFLETVGFEMDAQYGKAFQKVLNIITQVFFPKCKEVKCTGGAVTRLELILADYMKKRKFENPNGYMMFAYW